MVGEVEEAGVGEREAVAGDHEAHLVPHGRRLGRLEIAGELELQGAHAEISALAW